jgi:hypothetical protein
VINGASQDELGDAKSGIAWLKARGRWGTAAEWRSARAARDCLQSVIRGKASPSVLQGLLHRVAWRGELDPEGLRWRLDVPLKRTGAVAAVLAWAELRRTSPEPLRPCANDECRLFLLDRSESTLAPLVLDGGLRQPARGAAALRGGLQDFDAADLSGAAR